jgi:hypothetical protein
MPSSSDELAMSRSGICDPIGEHKAATMLDLTYKAAYDR